MVHKSTFLLKNIYLGILLCIPIYCISVPSYAKTNEQKCTVHVKYIKKLKNTIIVDVRDKKYFKIKKVANSINIPLKLIKTKSFLKNKKTLIMGNGWNEHLLIDECMKLKKNGFKSVSVLSGGVVSWYKGNNNILKRNLILLSSKEFLNNNIEKKFVPFIVSNKSKKQINITLPHAKIYTTKVTKRQLLKGLNRLGKGENPVVIFSENNHIVDTVINNYLKKPLRKIYYFEGGFDAYERIYNLNKMITISNKNKRISTKKPVSCSN